MARLILQRGAGVPEHVAIPAGATAGGGPGDAIDIADLPPAALVFTPSPYGVLVEVHAGEARVGDRALREGARRLLRAGEEVIAGGVVLGTEPREAAERTRELAAALLAEAAAGDAPHAGPRFLVVEGRDAGRALALREGVIIGRGPGAELRLRDARASRRHAALSVRDGRAALRDLGSKNGLAVNGRRAPRSVELSQGDLVEIGDTLLAYDDAGADVSQAAPPARARGRTAAEHPARRAERGESPRVARIALACGALLALCAALCLAAAG